MRASYIGAWAIIPEGSTECPFAVKSCTRHLRLMLAM